MTTSTTQTEPIDIGTLEHLRHLSASLDALRQTTTLTDVFVECGERSFPAHRLVLSVVSPYFKHAFEKCSTVIIPDISAQSMETILGFLYRGKVQDIRGDADDIAKLLQASHYLQIDELTKYSYNVLAEDHLTTSDFFDMYVFVVNLENDFCVRQTVSFLAKNFFDVANSKDFLLLPGNMLKKIIECDDLYQNNQLEDVIGKILKWAEFETPREQFLVEFLSIFDPHCCYECLTSVVEKYVCIHWSPEVARSLEAIYASRLSQVADNTTNQQKLYCFGEIGQRHVARVFDMKDYKWLPYQRLTFSLELGMAVVIFGHHIYFFGGREDIGKEESRPSGKMIQYCPVVNKVVDSAQTLPTPVFEAGAGALNGIIYVVNGRREVNSPALHIVQCYKRKDCIWGTAAPTQESHGEPYVFNFNQFLYVFGLTGSSENCIERYDPLSDQWTVLTMIPGGVTYHRAALCDAQVFIVEEFDSTQYHVYNFLSKIWLLREFKGRPSRIKGLWPLAKNGKSLLLICDSDNVFHTCDVESGCWIEPISQPQDEACMLIYFVQN